MIKKLMFSLIVLLALAGAALCGEEILTVEIEDVSAEVPGRDASDLISGSGLNINGPGTHSNFWGDMWWTGTADPNGTPYVVSDQYVIFDMGSVFRLDSIRIWNYNELYTGHPVFGNSDGQRGVQEMDLLVSLDGETYTSLGVFLLNRATDQDTYDFSQYLEIDAEARYVRFNVLSSWATVAADTSVGLSEVRFYGTPSAITRAVLPSPPDAAPGQDTEVMLSWRSGMLIGDVNAHDVYFGTDYAEVEQADTSSEVYQGRIDVNNFDPGPLETGRFYFWRVDEINEDTGQIAPGHVWTFATKFPPVSTVAPVSDGLVLHLDATVLDGLASGSKLTVWPGRVAGVDGTTTSLAQSGTVILDALNGQPVVRFSGTFEYYDFPEITNVRTVLWVLREDADAVTDYDFILGHTGSYSFHRGPNKEIWFPGVADAAITGGETRVNWTVVDGTVTRVPTTWSLVSLVTTGNVAANTLAIDRGIGSRTFDGDMAEVLIYDRPLDETELQEMAEYLTLKWDLATPFSPKASNPSPASGAQDVDYLATLTWAPGAQVGTLRGHDVYFGTDVNEVSTATPDSPTYMGRYDTNNWAVTNYSPGGLVYGATYYWRVDQVNETIDMVWTGNVWSFTVAEYSVLDGFESYETDEQLRASWWDWEGQEQAGRVITSVSVFLDTSGNPLMVRRGQQSMAYYYENASFEPFYSETQRLFDPPMDWTHTAGGEHRALLLHFRGSTGNPANPFEPLYVRVESAGQSHTVFYDRPSDLIWEGRAWQQWRIDFNDFSDNGVDLSAVTELVIGIGDEEGIPASGDGVIYVDDILLGTAEYLPIEEEEPNVPPGSYEVVPQAPLDAPAVWYKFDGNAADAAGTFSASAAGGAQFVSDDQRGQVLALDGGDWVEFPKIATDWNAVSISMWLKLDQVPGTWTALMTNNGNSDLFYQFDRDIMQFHLPPGNAVVSQTSMAELVGKWVHITVTHDGQKKVLYIDGMKDNEVAVGPVPSFVIGPGRIGSWSLDPGRDLVAHIDDVQIYNRALSQEEAAYLAGRTEPFDQPVPAE